MRWLVLSFCLACGSQWEPAGGMLFEGRSNDLAATQKYRGQELRLSGTVVSAGAKKLEHGAARTDARWTEAPATDADLPRAFVQIRDPDRPSPDVVTCLLAQGSAPKLAYGTVARVHGYFLEYVSASGHIEAVLDRCSLE